MNKAIYEMSLEEVESELKDYASMFGHYGSSGGPVFVLPAKWDKMSIKEKDDWYEYINNPRVKLAAIRI